MPVHESPRPAATVVLMRDAEGGLEVLLTERPRHLRFMGGALVFPGGSVSPEDRDRAWADLSTLAPAEAATLLGIEDPHEALGAYICAFREAYEEVGYLTNPGPLTEIRRDETDDPATFLRQCAARRVRLPTDELLPAGRWATPLGAPIRFDTHFFVTRVPGGWSPQPDHREVASCRWTTPADGLKELAAGTALMAPPTIEMLQLLKSYPSVEAALVGVKTNGLKGAGNVLSVRISPLVGVVLAPNAGLMTGPGTNTYVVGSGPCAVIDPAVADAGYLQAVTEMAGTVDMILITHRHSDHTGGAEALAELTGAPVKAWGPDAVAGITEVQTIADGDIIELPGTQLRALHTPGHASDHLSFYMEGAASLFAGDNILGEGTAVIAPPDGNMSGFIASLQRLQALHIDRIFPGHFRPLDGGSAVIGQLIQHRLDREAAILDALRQGAGSPEEIVPLVYRETPVALHPIAIFSVSAHLEKLLAEDRVQLADDRWSSPTDS